MVHTSLSPNVENDDRRLAALMLFSPWVWIKGGSLKMLAEALQKYLGLQEQKVLLFNSARAAFLTLLEALHIEADEEVLIQALTCNAVVNPVLWWGARPVYVDIDETYNMDPTDLERKITAKSKVVVIQHTFGIPAQIERILEIAQKHSLFVVEDCAHALGGEKQGQKLGTFGDAAFFSFGRDKVISSVFGGALTIKNENIFKIAEQEYLIMNYPSLFWTVRQIVHPLLTAPIFSLYEYGGKYILFLLQKAGILSKAVLAMEKRGKRPPYIPARLPNALAVLALYQLQKITYLNNRRRYLAEYYHSELAHITAYGGQVNPHDFKNTAAVFLRYPLRYYKRDEILAAGKKHGIILGDWYDAVVAPKGSDLRLMKYPAGSCPNAERAASLIFNLPTHINIEPQEALRIVRFLRNVAP